MRYQVKVASPHWVFAKLKHIPSSEDLFEVHALLAKLIVLNPSISLTGKRNTFKWHKIYPWHKGGGTGAVLSPFRRQKVTGRHCHLRLELDPFQGI